MVNGVRKWKEAQPLHFCIKHMAVSEHWNLWKKLVQIFFPQNFAGSFVSNGRQHPSKTLASLWWAAATLNLVKFPHVISSAADIREEDWDEKNMVDPTR